MTVTELKNSEVENLHSVFEKQKSSIADFRKEGISARKVRLKKLRKWILLNEAKIVKAVQADLGKPDAEVKLSEIRPVIAEIRKALLNINEWTGNHYVETPLSYMGTRSYIKYEPKGVALIMAPWNFPFNLTISPLVACLAAGNAAILKPSEKSANTSSLIVKMVGEVFSPKEVYAVTGDSEVAKQLLEFPFNHIFFTGSSRVGKEVMKAAAKHLAGITLELGGKSPAIVDATCNISDTAEKLVWGKFLNSGQTCIAPDYVLVHSSIKAKLLDKMKNNITRFFGRGSEKLSESPDYGRIIDGNHLGRLRKFMEEAIEKGATVAAGCEIDEVGKFISPTILENVTLDTMLLKEEIFGPILPIISFDKIEEAVSMVNSKPKPLALYIFSSNKKNIRRILGSTSSGTAVINDCVLQFSHPDLPFGGVNNSGIGKSHGFYGFKQFSNEKPVLIQRTGFTAVKMLYPPYKGFVNWWVNVVTRYF
jgi:aldehyde dehydrogenase (NAD+)